MDKSCFVKFCSVLKFLDYIIKTIVFTAELLLFSVAIDLGNTNAFLTLTCFIIL